MHSVKWNLFEVLQDAMKSSVRAAFVRSPAVDGRQTHAHLDFLGAHVGELPIVVVNHGAVRLEARQVLKQVRPVPSLHAQTQSAILRARVSTAECRPTNGGKVFRKTNTRRKIIVISHYTALHKAGEAASKAILAGQ